MVKRTLVSICFLIFLVFPHKVLATEEFSTSYKVSYDIDDSGLATVTEDIILKNLTDQYYASTFGLKIGATHISEVEAADTSGPLKTDITSQGKSTEIKVVFNQQVVGKDKDYLWKLKFKSKDFVENSGKVWQVNLPKISSLENLDNFDLILTVPVNFGDPTSMTPQPKSQSEIAGKINYSFTKDQLIDSGVSAIFGTDQTFNYELTYQLFNTKIFSKTIGIPLPNGADNQLVTITKIEPKPDNVLLDDEGNYIAWYKLDRNNYKTVKAYGMAKISIPKPRTDRLSIDQQKQYLKPDQFWESDNPIIKSKLDEIFKDKSPDTNKGKAFLINKYVVNTLSFNKGKLDLRNFTRLGGLTSLANPDKSLSSEYTDLFITLARAAQIPARRVVGLAYTSNPDIRPLSFSGDKLHTWPQYYDSNTGWISIDPTWFSITGSDYFDKFDLNHLNLYISKQSTDQLIYPLDVTLNFSDDPLNSAPHLNLVMRSPEYFFAGFPASLKVIIDNDGNTLFPGGNYQLSSDQLLIVGDKSFNLPPIPPAGNLIYRYNLKTNYLWQSFDDTLKLKVDQFSLSKKITVKPFFAPAIAGVFILMITIYMSMLTLHIKFHKVVEVGKKVRKEVKKEKIKNLTISTSQRAKKIFKKNRKQTD